MLGQRLQLHRQWCGHCTQQLEWCGWDMMLVHSDNVAARDEYGMQLDRDACILHGISGQAGHN
jgi:hypothetical protein